MEAKLPATSTELILIASLARVLDARDPGVIDCWVATLEDEGTKAEVTRLRGPRMEVEMRQRLADATLWVASLRYAAKAIPVPKRRWKLFG